MERKMRVAVVKFPPQAERDNIVMEGLAWFKDGEIVGIAQVQETYGHMIRGEHQWRAVEDVEFPFVELPEDE